MWNNWIGLVGYVILTIAYMMYIKENLLKGNLMLFGCLLITAGYLISAIEKSIKLAKNTKKFHKFNYGHIVLAIFYLSSFLFSINDHRKDSDTLALVGHILLIVNNDLDIVGLSSLFGYYILYIIRNYKEIEHLPNKFQVVGGTVAAVYYLIELINKFNKSKIE